MLCQFLNRVVSLVFLFLGLVWFCNSEGGYTRSYRIIAGVTGLLGVCLFYHLLLLFCVNLL
jgi:hypothetical protein